MRMKKDIFTLRNYKVVESNALILHGRYDLSAQQFKILLYCISKIKPGMEDFETYDFDLRELCRVCGIKELSQNYANFKRNIEKLANVSFWWDDGNKESLCRWFDKVEIYKRDTRVRIKINDVLKPHLLGMREDFTQYILENVAVMDSAYSIYLYRLMKSRAFLGEYEIPLVVLKDILQCSNDYDRYNNFKVRVLDKAMEEINHFSDLEVSYKPLRTGRSITAIHFTIKEKEGLDFTKAMLERSIVLNRLEFEKNQMRLDGFGDDEDGNNGTEENGQCVRICENGGNIKSESLQSYRTGRT